MSVFRIYVEKKPEFAVEAKNLLADVKTALRLDKLRSGSLTVMTQKVFPKLISSLLSEMYSPNLPLTPQVQSFPSLVKTKAFLPLSISPVSSTREPIPASSVSRSSLRVNAARSKMQGSTSLTVSFPQAKCLRSKHISSTP